MQGPDIFELHARLCRTLSNSTRLKILALLGKQERSVGELAEIIGVSPSNLSQHLAVLRAHHLVLARKRAQSVFYSLADRRMIQACALIRTVLLNEMKTRGEIAHGVDARYVVTTNARGRQ